MFAHAHGWALTSLATIASNIRLKYNEVCCCLQLGALQLEFRSRATGVADKRAQVAGSYSVV